MTTRRIVTLLAATLAAPVWADPSKIQPGLWEITTEMEMPGMPVQMAPQTIRHCHTAEELAEAMNTIPQGGVGDCRLIGYRVQGDTATWSMECSGDTPMRGTGSLTSAAHAYSGEMHSVMQVPGGSMEMDTRWRAKRIGECQ